MRALVCTAIGGEEHLHVQDDWPSEPCGPTQVRIDVAAASVNFPDVLIIRDLYQMKREPPFVPGNECAGVVTEVGADVEGLAVGDRVLALMGTGAFADEVVVATPPMQVHRIPEEMPFDEAAAFNLTYGTAGIGMQRGALRAGETVLVLGAAGGCGSAAIQIGKAMDATVIAVAGGPEKVALCEALGADHTIDHQTTASLPAAVKELTSGRGVDVLFDTVGGPDVRELLRCLGWNGRYLVVGFAGGDVPTIRLNQTILKSLSVVGVAYGASAIVDPAGNRALFDRLFAWYRDGLVRPHIGARFTLDDGAEAVRTLGERRALGKIVIGMEQLTHG
jgi:NADPH2:quinone reductase